MDAIEQSKVSFWETRTINIGDYEKVENGLSISHTIIKPVSGHGNKKIEIREAASIDTSSLQDINLVTNSLINLVNKKLDAREKVIRKQTAGWEGIGFDTEKKLVARGIINEKDYSGAHADKFKLTDKDLE